MLTYDKRIYAAQNHFKLSIKSIAEELEIKGNNQDKTEAIKRVIKNLNGYKLADNQEIALELVKEGRERYLVVGKRKTAQSLPEATTLQHLAT